MPLPASVVVAPPRASCEGGGAEGGEGGEGGGCEGGGGEGLGGGGDGAGDGEDGLSGHSTRRMRLLNLSCDRMHGGGGV